MAKGQEMSVKQKEKKIDVPLTTNVENKKKFSFSFFKWNKPKNTGSLKTSSKLKGMEITCGSVEPQAPPVADHQVLNLRPLKSALRDPNKKDTGEKKKVKFADDIQDNPRSSVRLSRKMRTTPRPRPGQAMHFERYKFREQRKRGTEPHPKTINYTEHDKLRKTSEAREYAMRAKKATNRRSHQKRHSLSISCLLYTSPSPRDS
eukprot:TRINITY_DN83_c0_g1_i2.p1 TRINITY_DN83_c0_g1~~TRINITY_DN83_c0_g1_i2.p1  ORF type:complete len:204 (-),score=29.49 TRINITY_DN83_c0_g1_i2:4-615(-)